MKRLLFVIACVGVGVIACSMATKGAFDTGNGASIRVAENTIAFSHYLHGEQGLTCEDCHASLMEKELETPAIPKMGQCADCHDVEDEQCCSTCHRNPKNPGDLRERPLSNLIFSHRAHRGDHGLSCDGCHKGAIHWPDLSMKPHGGLSHGDCVGCHNREIDGGNCKNCHWRLDLSTSKPEEIYSHGDGFFKRHGASAQGAEDMCAQCHEQSYCADCHNKSQTIRPSVRFAERVDRLFMHRGDWVSRHAVEARIGDTGCFKCHGTSFCLDCHGRSGVGGVSPVFNPHGDLAYWLRGHARAARRRIQECASCHDRGPMSNCVRCHAAGLVNPHPPGWKPPIAKNKRTSNQMCSICHTR
jgi:hypothetical protein